MSFKRNPFLKLSLAAPAFFALSAAAQDTSTTGVELSGALRTERNPTPSAQCRAIFEDQRSLRLRGGAIPFVAASSHARFRDQWLVTGSPTLVWPPGALPDFFPTRDEFVGFILTANGVVQMVANPVRGNHVLFPRVAPSSRGWHALLFESRFPDDGVIHPTDTVGVWYGEFSGNRWIGLKPIASLTRARFRPEYSSQLMTNSSGDLAFAYPMSATPPRADADKRGLVLLRSSGGRWTADTLWTPQEVVHVSLVSGRKGNSWDVLYRMRIADSSRVAPGSLFLALFDGRWKTSPPRVAAGTRSLDRPTLFRVGLDLYATWSQASDITADWANESVRLALLIDSATLAASSATVVARAAKEFTVTQLPDGKVVWALRDYGSARRLRMAYARGKGITSLGTVNLPNEAYPHIIAYSSSQVLILSARLGAVPNGRPVEQLLTRVAISCL